MRGDGGLFGSPPTQSIRIIYRTRHLPTGRGSGKVRRIGKGADDNVVCVCVCVLECV